MAVMTTARPLILRPHEAVRLAKHGEVLIVRKIPNPVESASGEITGWRDRWGNLNAPLRCPFGRVGDELAVKETWWDYGCSTHRCEHWTEADDPSDWYWVSVLDEHHHDMIRYDADAPTDLIEPSRGSRWHAKRSSTCMPKWASRSTVRVESVACRRIASVTEDEAITLVRRDEATGRYLPGMTDYAVWAFRESWEQQYGPAAWADDSHCWFGMMRRVDR
jgi:hypothetical protein